MKKSIRRSSPHSKVLAAVSAWISSHNFDDEPRQLKTNDSLTISFKQRLLDHDLHFYFSTDTADVVLAMMICIDDVEIPAKKQNFIREWITYRNIEIDVGSLQISPDSKSIYFHASIDMQGIDDINSQFISNLYVRGRTTVTTHIHEFMNLVTD